ncbi:hypothetical protein [Paracoccus denitrificans]|jgi:hypothetical protein|uniref:Uncharacterized protein n=1 Tax=Paracoccus denitrificans (strain Pd 1222) TaxID=318586 RepID=A1B4Q2_PARDP|nr:hypothetical protein [Paracoccus denitrificans]ABL70496.1 hypothetical protein Pden_2408 [Paracoccus denitrificans PD1222]MBB4629695.1 hypothetical protein [Paracoccus denitrificans]MCU7431111.1 hypothetical protein [Paracoccus denitrificans]QAR25836.1 hypothetical protein EO213_05715 [Paracoccus denitrificans]UFS65717.1 hypothetical protein LO749_03905 [Paracoccus denitrificans]
MSAMPAWSGDGAALRSLSPDAVRWLWRMGRALQAELAWPAPLYTVLFILSQIALLLALLLPWNILATLSLGHSSVRLQMIFGELGSGTVVTILMTLVLVCFVLHLAAEAGAARLGRYAAAIIVERHDKLGFSNSLREQASTYYRRFLRFFAMLAYCLIAAVLIGLSYPALLVILIAYVVAGTLLVSFLPLAAEQGVGAELRGKGWWGLGFLLLVGWVIHDAWRGAMPQFWAVFMALLLSRQILIFLMLSATILAGLLRRKERIEALFLADAPLRPAARLEGGLPALLAPPLRDNWLRPLLADMGARGFILDEAATQWAERGKILYLVARSDDPGDRRALLLKLFYQSLAGMGRHERDLLQAAGTDWPAPELLSAREVEGHLALVFRWRADWSWLPASKDRDLTLALREKLLACEIPLDLADRYTRSHQRLPQSLARIDWSILSGLAVTAEQAAACAVLHGSWQTVLDWLARQPSQIVLPLLTARRMAEGTGDIPRICNWTHWQWEPVGADWPFRDRPERELQQCLEAAARQRPALAGFQVADGLLVALLAEFLRRNQAGDFSAMLGMVVQLEAALVRCRLVETCRPEGEACSRAGKICSMEV